MIGMLVRSGNSSNETQPVTDSISLFPPNGAFMNYLPYYGVIETQLALFHRDPLQRIYAWAYVDALQGVSAMSCTNTSVVS